MGRALRTPPALVRHAVMILTGLTLVSGLVAGFSGIWTIRYELNEAMDAEMTEAAGRIAPLAVETLYGRDDLDDVISLPRASEQSPTSLLYQVRDDDGRVLMHSHEAPAEPFTGAVREGFQTTEAYRLYTLPLVSRSLFVQVAEPIGQRNEELFEAASGLLVPLALFVPLSGLLAWLLANRVFRPVNRLLAEIGDRHGDNLAPIRPEDFPAELDVAIATVNNLLARLRHSLDAEREFASNAAHELRTPIAGALAQTERLLAQRLPDKSAKRAELVHSALSRLSHVTERLLQLARASDGRSESLLMLDEVARAVAREYVNDHGGAARIQVSASGNHRETVRMDQDVLAIALRNLIDNALAYGDGSRKVDIRVGPGSRLSVINRGPVIEPDTLANLKRRYVRGTQAAGGSGIGLSIVEHIMNQSGGRLELHSPAEGEQDGFEARMVFASAEM